MKRKALFVGIDHYSRGVPALSCACNDANVLLEYFRGHNYKTYILRDGTTDQILDALDEQTKDLQQGDVFLFFFAGHGYTIRINDVDDRRLAGATDREDRIRSGQAGISLQELRARANVARCTFIVILDACQTKIGKTRASSQGARDACTKRDLAVISSVTKIDGANANPFIVINSCGEGEVAYELEESNQGLFSFSLLETLKEMESASETPMFDRFLLDRVVTQMQRTKGEFKQHPTLFPADADLPRIKIFGDGEAASPASLPMGLGSSETSAPFDDDSHEREASRWRMQAIVCKKRVDQKILSLDERKSLARDFDQAEAFFRGKAWQNAESCFGVYVSRVQELEKREKVDQLTHEIANLRKVSRNKMDEIEWFRNNKEGFEAHVESADAAWRVFEGLPNDIQSLADAEAVHKTAKEAAEQISRDLDWLGKNKAGRDVAKAVRRKVDELLRGDIVKFNAEQHSKNNYAQGKESLKNGEDAFGHGDFAEAKDLFDTAIEALAKAVDEAKTSCIKASLLAAERHLGASRWDECIAECDKVFGWDGVNAEARRLKHEVEIRRALAIAKGHFDAMRWDECRVACDKVLDLDGENDEARQLKKEAQDRLPRPGTTKTILLPGGATMELVWCPATTSDEWMRISGGKDYFWMGSPPGEEGRYDDEKQHRVTLTRGFWLGKYAVTQKQWQSVMGDCPAHFKGDNRPVEQVSWEDCQFFIHRANDNLDCEMRLPTEAEWEYACRAGTTGAYGGCGRLDEMGWYVKRMTKSKWLGLATEEVSVGSGETHPVGQKAPNAWGVYDMHGNVYEWCSDKYGDYGEDEVDPRGPDLRGSPMHVLRGGSWSSFAQGCRSADRRGNNYDCRSSIFGFRICCSAGRC